MELAVEAGHHACLLVLSDALLEEVGLTPEGDGRGREKAVSK